MGRVSPLDTTASAELFARASAVTPGGVNSPVRAFNAVGGTPRFIESARPDQQGRFTIRGLPPGTYVAIAVGYLEPGEERNPDLLEGWRQRGTLFTLSDGETHALDLKLSGS